MKKATLDSVRQIALKMEKADEAQLRSIRDWGASALSCIGDYLTARDVGEARYALARLAAVTMIQLDGEWEG